MTLIRQDDFIDSIADALQFISYYHPTDFLKAMGKAWEREQSPAAKDAMAQILVNSRMCAEGKRPICQDTGMVVVFLKVGMDVRWDSSISITEMVDEGVRRAYSHPDNILRASMVTDPAGGRLNTKNNTPAIVHTELVPGDRIEVKIASKGGGSENKTRFAILNPSASLVEWVLEQIPQMGAGWCPPGMLGIGIGGSAEKAMLLAKESLMGPIDIHELKARGATNTVESLRLELYEKINALGIGAQGLGGLTTVLDVKISDFPTHATSLPVAIIPNCAATRHAEFTLDGSGPAVLTPPQPDDWPAVTWEASDDARRVDLNSLTKQDIAAWQPGDRILLSGKLLTGRDAAHKRIADLLQKGEPLPKGVDFHNRFIYYVGPVDPVREEVVGPAGPTTASRMDKFSEMMLGQTGLIGMVGKSERGPSGIEAIKHHKAVYLMAVGGAAYLVSKAIRASRIIAFEELGMEAIREFEVVDFPVTVAVDSLGNSVHETGPAEWRSRIADIPVIIE
ncbi:MAG: fumarate hydratase [Gammaproteobacteria bacterium (ex Lamellibrachia satsuma)]|nr:MAG: fumarate hydratase [Gammaproteobacteria bacterium (ex Lamellibrachia satsuma)]RRS31537.1 MAG: fumarate hydratase [Gammaproteobacteria bacterium (ex Lamellibrachia satsuma)]RRS35818.1 MAG: fumarate hydratase [Gammaproteobacteria bacterium (ex Lamellibrachia satsuma)]